MKDKDLSLLRKKNKNIYHIVVKKRVQLVSNLGLIGKISKTEDNYGLVYLNLKKLTKYLYKGISISELLGKILGIENNKNNGE